MPVFEKASVIRLGVHTSIAGGLHLSIERAKKLGCTTLQIFSNNPRQWKIPPLLDSEILRFKKLRAKYDINPVYIHTSYLINLCSAKEEVYRKSIRLLRKEMDIADILGAEYLVLHTGIAKDSTRNEARERAIYALKTLSEEKRWNARILLENTAGRKGDITSQFEDLAVILKENIRGIVGGICIDTSHAHAAGYDLSDMKGLADFINEIETYIGIENVKLIHLNDSKRPCNSKIDRHEHIGKGTIGMDAMRRLITHPTFYGIPLILETPKKSNKDDAINLKTVRSFLKRASVCKMLK